MKKKKDFVRMSKAAKDFNTDIIGIVELLKTRGVDVELSPTTKLSLEVYALLEREFGGEDMPIKGIIADREIASAFAERELNDPVLSSIWDLITEMGKYRFDYADFEGGFNADAKQIPHNLLKLILLHYAHDKTEVELSSNLFIEMATLGMIWEPDDRSDFLAGKKEIFNNEITLGKKVIEMLDRGEDPEGILYAVKNLLTNDY